MAPLCSPPHKVLYITHAVHVAHLGVTVKFYPLNLFIVRTDIFLNRICLLDTLHVAKRQFSVKGVDIGYCLNGDTLAHIQIGKEPLLLFKPREHLHRDGIGIISHGLFEDGVFL